MELGCTSRQRARRDPSYEDRRQKSLFLEKAAIFWAALDPYSTPRSWRQMSLGLLVCGNDLTVLQANLMYYVSPLVDRTLQFALEAVYRIGHPIRRQLHVLGPNLQCHTFLLLLRLGPSAYKYETVGRLKLDTRVVRSCYIALEKIRLP
jgi:hypothetical protein